MYSAVLLVHSWIRWLVLIAGILAVVRALVGWSSGGKWSPLTDKATRIFSVGLDVQMLLGLILYVVLSPFTTAAFADMGAAMRDPGLRFWTVEHITGMIAALAFAHIGRGQIRKATTDRERHQRTAIFFGLSLVIILFSIPWPGLQNGRPLFRY